MIYDVLYLEFLFSFCLDDLPTEKWDSEVTRYHCVKEKYSFRCFGVFFMKLDAVAFVTKFLDL